MPLAFNPLFVPALLYRGLVYSTSVSAMPVSRAGAMATAVSVGFTLCNFRQPIVDSEERVKRFERVTTSLPLAGEKSMADLSAKLKVEALRWVAQLKSFKFYANKSEE